MSEQIELDPERPGRDKTGICGSCRGGGPQGPPQAAPPRAREKQRAPGPWHRSFLVGWGAAGPASRVPPGVTGAPAPAPGARRTPSLLSRPVVSGQSLRGPRSGRQGQRVVGGALGLSCTGAGVVGPAQAPERAPPGAGVVGRPQPSRGRPHPPKPHCREALLPPPRTGPVAESRGFPSSKRDPGGPPTPS